MTRKIFFWVIVVMIVGSGAYGAVSDHVLKIEISKTHNYYPPDHPPYDEFEFDALLLVDETVTSAVMETPGGDLYPMSLISDGTEVELVFNASDSDQSALDALFGVGTYTFTVYYQGGSFDSTSINYELPGGDPIPWVTQEPQFTYPQHNAVGVPLYCTVEFDPSTNPDHTIDIWVEPDNGSEPFSYEEEGLAYDTSSYGPVTLSPATLYKAGYTINHVVTTVNADGIPTVMDTDAETQIHFTTAALSTLSGWVWMESGTDFGYSLNEGDLVYFVSSDTVWNLNLATGQWVPDKPAGWIYINWPFYY
ncbi:MAG: hypothetical protein ACYS6K_14205, partial [Planctomycetota bacterium]